ncbi:Type I restriction-modification system, restriction subunit R [Indibacter alkaliphilus LW1]|uniref:Type I restriction enzyme endonuclease subunit n=1 Tax=Indibacter alkaliphilus (strain CCUG 57479 / KCTC 22604 / LW1) TaxID=1189612 RepID=S2DRU9_INDAL|nr:type I restriction endonuclease subunit R [Indibacter alkaliphilus]EPA00011.1 Type I restriction-modification system, restriction subunit R [Indibacter alkaliphilus LW1]
MTTQPEQTLENNLIAQLAALGYKKVLIPDETALLANLKTQLEKHNKTQLSEKEFTQILNAINKGNVFERAKILRDRVEYMDDSGEHRTVELINQIHWCQNEFQVAQQISMKGLYKNRYDVTILINGLPLVQVELKRRGLELKEAFKQTSRYGIHSYSAGHGLFQLIQIFVISNGVNTKYYANGPLKSRSFKQTFYWSDIKNKLITQLSTFADYFLEPCHISKMITKYLVLNETEKTLMVLRPYQYYATEAIVERVKTTTKYGYIWHTTGSGKTLTSFKTAQILTNLPQVHKVVFVVDRKDLDTQTSQEFNSFSKGSIDGTNNTNKLVKQLTGNDKLIVTTIQKLSTAVNKARYVEKMASLKDKRIVFIFDECHRSQFGKTHADINEFFGKCQMFGFTGTPIFEENAGTNEWGKRTTEMLFGDCLHKYVITDAIRDENVLKFSVEYISTFRKKEHIFDINVEAIDEEEVMNAPQRLNNIVDYILTNHKRKTHNKAFTAIFCVPSVPLLIAYYKLFQDKYQAGEHQLKVGTIFSYGANTDLIDDDIDELGLATDEYETYAVAAEPDGATEYQRQCKKHPREYLDEFIADYNTLFGTKYNTKDSKTFYNYYNDIANRVKNKEVDILLVVNMFLTGFDSKNLNTLYVDKNLKYHGLIQAYSRTNRILDELKSQGNIVCFRNLKGATDKAISLFSNLEEKGEIIMEPYEEYVEKFNQAFIELLQVAPTVNSVNDLQDEEAQLAFIKAFRELMRLKNVLVTFTEFEFDDLSMPEQTFEDYKSKYLDLYDRAKNNSHKEKISILNDVDFELELIHRDEINVSYILKLLGKLKDASPEEQEKQKKAIVELIVGEAQLRSKKELIEKFIRENLPKVADADDIPEEFTHFWTMERLKALHELSEEENLDDQALEKVIGDFIYTEKEPLRDDIIGLLKDKPALKERKTIAERIKSKILGFVETFINGISEAA